MDGTETPLPSDFETNSISGDRLHSPDHHPTHEHVHSIQWPGDLQFPYLIHKDDYSTPDEPVVDTLNSIPAIVATCRDIDFYFQFYCKDGSDDLRRIQQGADPDTAITESHCIAWYKALTEDGVIRTDGEIGDVDRLEHQCRCLHQWHYDSMPRFDEPTAKLYEWLKDVYTIVDVTMDVIDSAWNVHYDEGGWFDNGEWVVDPVATTDHITRLERMYDHYTDAVYDIELETVVTELYEGLETPKETNEKLEF